MKEKVKISDEKDRDGVQQLRGSAGLKKNETGKAWELNMCSAEDRCLRLLHADVTRLVCVSFERNAKKK